MCTSLTFKTLFGSSLEFLFCFAARMDPFTAWSHWSHPACHNAWSHNPDDYIALLKDLVGGKGCGDKRRWCEEVSRDLNGEENRFQCELPGLGTYKYWRGTGDYICLWLFEPVCIKDKVFWRKTFEKRKIISRSVCLNCWKRLSPAWPNALTGKSPTCAHTNWYRGAVFWTEHGDCIHDTFCLSKYPTLSLQIWIKTGK